MKIHKIYEVEKLTTLIHNTASHLISNGAAESYLSYKKKLLKEKK